MDTTQAITSILINKDAIEQASQRLRKFIGPTPVLYSNYYSTKYDSDIFFKLENLQPTHSFKVRGGISAVTALTKEQLQRGIICASGGNHGLGVAFACSKLQVSCRVFLPETTPEIKINAIKKLGAIPILHGSAWDEANKLAMQTANSENCTYIHTFDDTQVMAGHATMILELLEQLKEIDTVVVSIGGGGLISGIVSAIKHFSPKTKVIGVETKGADCLSRSVQAGHIVELSAITSVAESLGAKKTEARQFEIISRYVDELITVEDKEAIDSLLELLQEEKLLVEPASSCSLAALESGKIKTQLGKRIAVIMCGGNVSLDRVCQWRDKS